MLLTHSSTPLTRSLTHPQWLKSLRNFAGPTVPKDVAAAIAAALPPNPLTSQATAAPNGFINIRIGDTLLSSTLHGMLTAGVKAPPVPRQKVRIGSSRPCLSFLDRHRSPPPLIHSSTSLSHLSRSVTHTRC